VASESARCVAWKNGEERMLYRPQRFGSAMGRSIGKEPQSANTGLVLADLAIHRSGARIADPVGAELGLTNPWPMPGAFRPTIIRNPNKSHLLRILIFSVY
jgi:hypothetical protein